MPDSAFYRTQADRFDRVAEQCSVPELVSYYRQLAEAFRRAADHASPAVPRGQHRPIEFPEGANGASKHSK